MEGESNQAWKMYYHSYGGTTNKQNFNYLDDTGSESSDLYGYIASTYYGQKLNKNKYNEETGKTEVGYDWYPVLAKTKPGTDGTKEEDFMPQPLNLNTQTNLATQYKVYLRTEKDGLVYNSASSKRTGWQGRGVKLEDYVTPFMLLLNGNIGLARNADYISDSNNATLKGAKAFSDATEADQANGGNVGSEEIQDMFYSLVGIELNTDESSITFTFNTPVNQFTAMTNLSSTLNSPIPLEFIEQLGNEYADAISDAGKKEEAKQGNNIYRNAMKHVYGTVNANNSSFTPVDNVLSIAPYMLEAVDSTHNVYKKNDKWFEFKSSDPTISSRYKIQGVKIEYLQAAASDPNAAFTTFIKAGTLDAVSIPKDYMSQYVNDPRTTTTEGDSTFKLNLNTATQEEWDKLFEDTKNESDYECKPLMANDDFINALSFAIDRETYATKRGSIPSQSYFAPSYLWEPEKGYSYDKTAQHKAAVAEYSPQTNGYNKDLAIQLFDRAIKTEIGANHYTGFKDSETIDIYWMNTTDKQEYGDELTKYFDDAFKETDAYKKGFRINFVNHNGTTNYQDVYDRMGKGQFDLAFGSVSGMQLDPLGFMEVLKSDNTSGFTLNWGPDTSSMDEDKIIYDGKEWSFDGLWTAATKGAVVQSDGSVNKQPVNLQTTSTSGKPTDTGDVWELSYRFTTQVQESGLSFKLFAESARKSDESVTVSISYKPKGETASKTAVFNAYYGDNYVVRNGIDVNTGVFKTDANFTIKLPKVLNGLGINNELHDLKMKELDGNQKVKVLLAQALFGNPDVLLLDEPTNHLDLESIRWLENFLMNFKNTVIVVSHDRYFLNKVCTHIADIDYSKIQLYVGNYDFWYEYSQLQLQQAKDQNKKAEAKKKELEEFIARFSANASKAKQATSRKKLLDNLEMVDIKPSLRRYPFISFKPGREVGNIVLKVEGLSKTVEGVKLLNNVSFSINPKDKVAFVGDVKATEVFFKIIIRINLLFFLV